MIRSNENQEPNRGIRDNTNVLSTSIPLLPSTNVYRSNILSSTTNVGHALTTTNASSQATQIRRPRGRPRLNTRALSDITNICGSSKPPQVSPPNVLPTSQNVLPTTNVEPLTNNTNGLPAQHDRMSSPTYPTPPVMLSSVTVVDNQGNPKNLPQSACVTNFTNSTTNVIALNNSTPRHISELANTDKNGTNVPTSVYQTQRQQRRMTYEGKVVLPFLFHPPPLLTELMDYNGGECSSGVVDNNLRLLVQDLITMLDIHNLLVQSFRMAKDRFIQTLIQPVTLCLIGTRQHTGRQYNLPIALEVVALIPGNNNPIESRDVIVEERETNAEFLGRKNVLPSTFTGGPRHMIQQYQDAMAICCWARPSDLFVTMTCNLKWPESQRDVENYIPGQPTVDRPDTIARVFKMKLDDLMDDIRKGNHFGRVKTVIYIIEFQKCGLPHCHSLIFLHEHDKISSTDEINYVISVELPSEVDDPIGFNAVRSHMMHGPCGDLYKSASCMSRDTCVKGYPKEYCEDTFITRDGWPHYKRPNNGRKVQVV
ncbi:hypothetical protein Tco_1172960 [Tanacetum coccineum]